MDPRWTLTTLSGHEPEAVTTPGQFCQSYVSLGCFSHSRFVPNSLDAHLGGAGRLQGQASGDPATGARSYCSVLKAVFRYLYVSTGVPTRNGLRSVSMPFVDAETMTFSRPQGRGEPWPQLPNLYDSTSREAFEECGP